MLVEGGFRQEAACFVYDIESFDTFMASFDDQLPSQGVKALEAKRDAQTIALLKLKKI